MGETIFVAKETVEGEKRVGATPETVKKICALGYQVLVEKSAGIGAHISDEAYKNAGASIVSGAEAKKARVILKVRRPSLDEAALYEKGAIVIAMFDPFDEQKTLETFARKDLTCFSLELMARITRAQSMDVLSSQANLAGYQSVIDAASIYGQALPMMMTAAGTVAPAKVFVMGAGVAGLQAIATARRLGAIVSASDVRPAAKEQVLSLGAKFIAVENEEFKAAETAAGYAKKMSDSYLEAQSALIAQHMVKQDIVITTALIPGQPAPKLVTTDMIKSMREGSVVLDMAIERGGNVEGSVKDQVVDIGGVKVVAYSNMASRIAPSATPLYARNLLAFLTLLTGKDNTINIDYDDAIIQATLITDKGKLLYGQPKESAQNKAAKKEGEPAPISKANDSKPDKKASKPKSTIQQEKGEQ